MRHVVWDWNGTLLDDLPLVVESVNAFLGGLGEPLIAAEDYTANYTRPVREFYGRLLGRPLSDAEWAEADRVFHTAYDQAVADHAVLMAGAREALLAVQAAGVHQSLLSMYRHERLVPLLEHFRLTQHFEVIQGLTGPGGGPKLPHLERHLEEMVHAHGGDPSQVLVIGDAIDDAYAAEHVGARCVLLASGSHPRDELESTGQPVVESLAAALDVGGIFTTTPTT